MPDGDYRNEIELRRLSYGCWNGSYLMRDLLGESWSIDEDDEYFDSEFTSESFIEDGYIYHFLDVSERTGDIHYFTIIKTREIPSKTYHISTYGGIHRIYTCEVKEDITKILRSIINHDIQAAIKFWDIPIWDLGGVKYPSRLYYHRHPIRPVSILTSNIDLRKYL